MDPEVMKQKKSALHGLTTILNKESIFDSVVKEVFKTIDVDGSGEIDASEIKQFLDEVCESMGSKKPDQESIDAVFKELDKDGSGDISVVELSEFLRAVFGEQKNTLQAELKDAGEEI